MACGLITKNLLRDLSMLLGSRSASAAIIFLLSVPCLPWTCPLFISFHKPNASSQSTAIAFPQSTWWEGGRKEGTELKTSLNSLSLKKKKSIITMFWIQFYFKIPFGIPAFISVTHKSKSLKGKPLKKNEILETKRRKHA